MSNFEYLGQVEGRYIAYFDSDWLIIVLPTCDWLINWLIGSSRSRSVHLQAVLWLRAVGCSDPPCLLQHNLWPTFPPRRNIILLTDVHIFVA